MSNSENCFDKIYILFKEKRMKKVLSVVMAVVLCVAFLTACAKPAAEVSEAPSATVEATESAATTESAEVSTEPAEANGEFMSWSAEEWNAASEDQKLEAAEALLVEVGDVMMGEDFAKILEEAKTNEAAGTQIKTLLKTQIIPSIDQFFESLPTGNLQMFVDAMKSAKK